MVTRLLKYRVLLIALIALLTPRLGVAQAHRTWYLAEGATGAFFEEDILIGNPNAAAADIRITYLTPGGSPIVQTFTMEPTSRRTVRVNAIPGLQDAQGVAAVVECTNALDIVVERSMYWRDGLKLGGHNSPGVLGTATRWFLAEGATGFFDLFVLISNPDAAKAADVKVTFLKEDGSTIEALYTIEANSRFTVWVNAMVPGLENAAFSTVVESTNGVGLFVERAMYWPAGNANAWDGGHGSVAVTEASTTWRFAEGFTGTGFADTLAFETYLLLANPGDSPADVKVTYFRTAGAPIERTYTVDSTSRLNIHVDSIPGLDLAEFSALVESTNAVPIVAERAMYWGPNTPERPGVPAYWVDGHNSSGVIAEAQKWGLAEGTSDSTFDTYILVVNSNPGALQLKATFYREDGKGIQKTYTVQGESRFNIVPGQYPELQGRKYSTFVESTDGQSFVAERAMYWGRGYDGGHGSTGTPWTGTIAAPPSPNPPVVVTTTDVSLAFGDSITEGVTSVPVTIGTSSAFVTSVPEAGGGYPARLQSMLQTKYPTQTISVQNAGKAGEYAFDGRSRLGPTFDAAHDLLILLEGVNDTNVGRSATQIAGDLRAMVRNAKGRGKNVIISTLTPVYAQPSGMYKADAGLVKALNNEIRKVAASENVILVDMEASFGNNQSFISVDGLHPSSSGYQKMAQEFFNAIVAHFETTVPSP